MFIALLIVAILVILYYYYTVCHIDLHDICGQCFSEMEEPEQEYEHPFYEDPSEENMSYPKVQDDIAFRPTQPFSMIDSSAYAYNNLDSPEEIILNTKKGTTGDDRFYNINKKRAQMDRDSKLMFRQNYGRAMRKFHESDFPPDVESSLNWLNDYFPDFD